MWLEEIEDGAMNQIRNLANLPFAFHHIAIMPDSHQGYGMPIGGVMVTTDVIVPNAVGVDIGCGMCAVKTSLTELNKDTLKKIMGEIRKAVPVGFNHHKEKQFEKHKTVKEVKNFIDFGEYVIAETENNQCPFLDNCVCSIYDERPEVCRKFGDETHPNLICPFQDKDGRIRSRQERRKIERQNSQFVDNQLKIIK